MIYLDNASTTKPSKIFIDAYVEASMNSFYNASASYELGVKSSKIIENVKTLICENIGRKYKNNVIFTGGATEANNLAIMGCYRSNWKEVMLSEGEHPSVFNIKSWLENKGVKVTLIPLQKDGTVDYNYIENNITQDTNFLSVMIVNNETGAINNINKIRNIIKRRNLKTIIHCDAVQAFGKIDLTDAGQICDLMTLSAHKMGGCKGLGALFMADSHMIKPIVYGGGQEFGVRSGTENVPAIYAFGEIIKNIDIEKSLVLINKLRETLLNTLSQNLSDFICNSSDNNSPYIVSLSFPNINGETLARILETKGLIVSTGSACSSKKKGNRTLSAMGVSENNILGSIRVSFYLDNSPEDAINAANIICDTYKDLKKRMGVK